uniref:Uncharacterized protein n=1 Tax=Ditylenchus dipsaci TaxID=166011 RepID=A0A915CT06_9BILA
MVLPVTNAPSRRYTARAQNRSRASSDETRSALYQALRIPYDIAVDILKFKASGLDVFESELRKLVRRLEAKTKLNKIYWRNKMNALALNNDIGTTQFIAVKHMVEFLMILIPSVRQVPSNMGRQVLDFKKVVEKLRLASRPSYLSIVLGPNRPNQTYKIKTSVHARVFIEYINLFAQYSQRNERRKPFNYKMISRVEEDPQLKKAGVYEKMVTNEYGTYLFILTIVMEVDILESAVLLDQSVIWCWNIAATQKI